MNKRDILHEVYNKKLTDQQARDLVEQAYEANHIGKLTISAREYASMSFDEFTALTFHNLSFTDIAKLRYENWPYKCVTCDRNIIFGPNGTGWWIYRSQLIRGKLIRNALVCLKCADVLAGIFMKKKAIAFKKLHKKRKNKRRFVSK